MSDTQEPLENEAPKHPPGWDPSDEAPVSRVRRRRRQVVEPLVNLTSMVDVLAVLMFFLLTMYSGGGYLTTLPSGLHLPASTARPALTRNIEVSVLRDRILLEREEVADDLPALEAGEGLLLPALHAELLRLAPKGEDEARITIMADRTVPFRLLKKVMYTLDQAGFPNQSLAVRQLT